MAHDDMHVVMYKILGYLYYCMRNGFEPREAMLSHKGDMLSIPYPYWESIMGELVCRGFVRGVSLAKDGVYLTAPSITLEGVEFLQENSMMAKALDFLKEAKSALPFV